MANINDSQTGSGTASGTASGEPTDVRGYKAMYLRRAQASVDRVETLAIKKTLRYVPVLRAHLDSFLRIDSYFDQRWERYGARYKRRGQTEGQYNLFTEADEVKVSAIRDDVFALETSLLAGESTPTEILDTIEGVKNDYGKIEKTELYNQFYKSGDQVEVCLQAILSIRYLHGYSKYVQAVECVKAWDYAGAEQAMADARVENDPFNYHQRRALEKHWNNHKANWQR